MVLEQTLPRMLSSGARGMSRRRIEGSTALGERGVFGYVVDRDDLQSRFVVELLINGLPVSLTRADAFAPELSQIGDGCYGFGFSLPDTVLDDADSIAQVRLANTDEMVGREICLGSCQAVIPSHGGYVAWVGGLRLCGWLATSNAGGTSTVRAVVQGRPVATSVADSWTYRRRGTMITAVPAFDIHLPHSLADGQVHRVEVLDDSGQALHGSPCCVLAISDDFRDDIINQSTCRDSRTRLAIMDRMAPRSVPFSDWQIWRDRFQGHVRGDASLKKVLIVLIGGEPTDTLKSLEQQYGVDWILVHLPAIEDAGVFDASDLNKFIMDTEPQEAVLFAMGGTRFHVDSVQKLIANVSTENDVSITYADTEVSAAGQCWPILWPAYDAERQLEQGYGALVFAARAEAVGIAVKRGANSLPAVFLEITRGLQSRAAGVLHIPEVLTELPSLDPTSLSRALARAAKALLTAQGIGALVVERPGKMLPAVRIRRKADPASVTVAVIAPRHSTVKGADLELLQDRFSGRIQDFIIACHYSVDAGKAWTVLNVPGHRNPSRLRNAAMARASGQLILFLNAGLSPLSGECIDEMSGRLLQSGVAAVSGVELGPNHIVLQAGVVLGVDYGTAPAFAGLRAGAPGYSDALHVARGCGALDAACLMVRRADLGEVAGFDEVRFPERFSGVDMSMRLRATGANLVVTPYAAFTRDIADAPLPPDSAEMELVSFRNRWGQALLDDPFYHPALNLDHRPFTGLAWPPRPCRSRYNEQLHSYSTPPGY